MRVPVYWCTGVLAYQCTGVPVYACACVPMYRYTCAPVYWCMRVLVYRCTCVPVGWYIDALVYLLYRRAVQGCSRRVQSLFKLVQACSRLLKACLRLLKACSYRCYRKSGLVHKMSDLKLPLHWEREDSEIERVEEEKESEIAGETSDYCHALLPCTFANH